LIERQLARQAKSVLALQIFCREGVAKVMGIPINVGALRV